MQKFKTGLGRLYRVEMDQRKICTLEDSEKFDQVCDQIKEQSSPLPDEK